MRQRLFFHILVLVSCSLIGCLWHPIKAQPNSSSVDRATGSYIDISPAELESLLEQLLVSKQQILAKRQMEAQYYAQRTSPQTEPGASAAIMANRLAVVEEGVQKLLLRSENQPQGYDNWNENGQLQHIQDDLRQLTKQLGQLEQALSDQIKYQEWNKIAKQEAPDPELEQPLQAEPPTPLDSLLAFLIARTSEEGEITPVSQVDTLLSVSRDTIFIMQDGFREQQGTSEATMEPQIVRETIIRDSVVLVEQQAVSTREENFAWPVLHFDHNSAAVTQPMHMILEMVAADFNAQTNVVRIVGYASSSGDLSYNQELANQRAKAVSEVLQILGVPKQNLQILAGGVDYRWSNPAAARRVEVFTVTKK